MYRLRLGGRVEVGLGHWQGGVGMGGVGVGGVGLGVVGGEVVLGVRVGGWELGLGAKCSTVFHLSGHVSRVGSVRIGSG